MVDFSGPAWDAFREVCDGQNIAITASDADADDLPLAYANKTFCDLTGYTEKRILGCNCRFLQGPDTREEDRQTLRAGIADRGYSATCLLNYRKDGTPFFNMLVISSVKFDSVRTLLLGCQYPFEREVRLREMQEQFRRSDDLFETLEARAYEQLREAHVMHSAALTSMVRARLTMAWVKNNVRAGVYNLPVKNRCV